MKTENNTNDVIQMDHVSRVFDGVTVLHDFNLRVPRGSIYGFLGLNGAGKTTAIKIMAGLIKPTMGSARVLDRTPFDFTPEDRQRVGYVSEKQILPANFKVGKLVEFCAQFYPRWDHELCTRLLDRFRLDRKKRVATLSQGGQRQLAFILALAQQSELLILDEPAATLDVLARRQFLDEILEVIRQGDSTVFLSSHILSDIERVADHIGIIADGTLKISESLDELKDRIKKIRFHSARKSLQGLALPGTLRTTTSEMEMTIVARIDDEALIAQAAREREAQYEIESLTLEDIFVEISRR